MSTGPSTASEHSGNRRRAGADGSETGESRLENAMMTGGIAVEHEMYWPNPAPDRIVLNSLRFG